MSHKLDQIVKGAPPPAAQVSDPPSAAPTLPDPTALLPSSPPQIYLNLLILEASLRAQYLSLRARRQRNTLVLCLMSGWVAGHAYILYQPHPATAPAPDESGTSPVPVGATGYWLMDLWSKLALMSGVVTLILFWGTGQWERGVRWPRRWVGVSNRGLRVFNCKIVVLKGPWWRELLSHVGFFTSGGSYAPASRRPSTPSGRPSTPSKHLEPPPHHGHHHSHSLSSVRSMREAPVEEEDLTPGGDQIKLLLLSKPFSPDFRQDWETYRDAYWEKENERRAELRRRLAQRQRERAKQQGGWLWWTGWRGWPSWMSSTPPEPPLKTGHLSASNGLRRRASTATRDRAGSFNHSRSSSRSATPGPDPDEGRSSRATSMLFEQLDRRMSTSSSAGTRRRKNPSNVAPSARSSLVMTSGETPPGTPTDFKAKNGL